ncbi:MAG TPA: hypothetical protein V6C72_02755, partial [Chroococcales cyanobacterium]
MSSDLAAIKVASPSHDETSARLSQEAHSGSDSIFDKVGRECDLLFSGTLEGMKNGISGLTHNPLNLLETIAIPVALTCATRGPAQIRLAAEAAGLVATVAFGKQVYDGVSTSLPAFQDAWGSNANFSQDKQTVENNLGPIAFNVAVAGAAGIASGKIAQTLSLKNAEIPITNYGEVSDGLSRGGQLTRAGMQHLSENNVNTIVDLRLPGLGAWREGRMARSLGMDYYNLPLVRGSAGRVSQIMDVINNPDTGSVYVHC